MTVPAASSSTDDDDDARTASSALRTAPAWIGDHDPLGPSCTSTTPATFLTTICTTTADVPASTTSLDLATPLSTIKTDGSVGHPTTPTTTAIAATTRISTVIA